jgi:hypothetical protein
VYCALKGNPRRRPRHRTDRDLTKKHGRVPSRPNLRIRPLFSVFSSRIAASHAPHTRIWLHGIVAGSPPGGYFHPVLRNRYPSSTPGHHKKRFARDGKLKKSVPPDTTIKETSASFFDAAIAFARGSPPGVNITTLDIETDSSRPPREKVARLIYFLIWGPSPGQQQHKKNMAVWRRHFMRAEDANTSCIWW